MAADYYTVLGVEPDAAPEEIKRAFRRLAREHHPDATGGDMEAERRYKEISEAYAVLSDPERRRQYDMARMGAGSGFGTTIEDLFETFFGGGTVRGASRERSRAGRGESIELQLELEIRDVVFGVERTLRFQRLEPCERCDASGAEPGTEPVRCEQCGGTGQVQQTRRTVLGSLVTAFPCRTCDQSGWVVPDPCEECRGSGRLPTEVEIPVKIPPGVETGDRLRVTGAGESGVAGGPRGDLYVRFFVRPDERFARSGDDLVTWVEIPMTTAVLGGEVSFESLDGTEELHIPRGTQSGDVFRVGGRGLPRSFGRGELIVKAHVTTPTDLSTEQEELVRKLADLRGESAEGPGMLRRLRRVLRMEE